MMSAQPEPPEPMSREDFLTLADDFGDSRYSQGSATESHEAESFYDDGNRFRDRILAEFDRLKAKAGEP